MLSFKTLYDGEINEIKNEVLDFYSRNLINQKNNYNYISVRASVLCVVRVRCMLCVCCMCRSYFILCVTVCS